MINAVQSCRFNMCDPYSIDSNCYTLPPPPAPPTHTHIPYSFVCSTHGEPLVGSHRLSAESFKKNKELNDIVKFRN